MSKQWYAVYSKPQAEKKVVEIFRRKSIECYCPLSQQTQKQGLMKKSNFQPLFKSYVFVKADEGLLKEILRMDSVINVIYWLGKPAVIREVEINMMRQFLEDHTEIKLERTPVCTNEIVRIIKTTQSEVSKGIGHAEKEIFKLVLPSLGYAIVAEASTSIVRMVKGVDILNHNNANKAYAVR